MHVSGDKDRHCLSSCLGRCMLPCGHRGSVFHTILSGPLGLKTSWVLCWPWVCLSWTILEGSESSGPWTYAEKPGTTSLYRDDIADVVVETYDEAKMAY